MFGFSIFKIFFTVAMVVLVWQAFKWLKRREGMIKARGQGSLRAEAEEAVEEMIQCPDCGAYVAKGSGHICG